MSKSCLPMLVLAASFWAGGLLADEPDLDTLEETAFKRAAAIADPGMVRIDTVGGLERVDDDVSASTTSTGLFASEDGYILTSSFSFAGKPSAILVTLQDGRRVPAKLVASDRLRMLTLIKVEAVGTPPPVGDVAEGPKVGQWALALGRTYDSPQPSMSVGIVSALGRIWGKAIQTDAKVSPVNYGGPLVDVRGRVMGIVVPLSPQANGDVAGVEWYDGGIGFAIPWLDALASAERLKAGKDLVPGLMGVVLKSSEEEPGARPKVDRVRYGSPADKAGIKVGDIVEKIADRPLRRTSDLQMATGTKYAGDVVPLEIRRGEVVSRVEVTLTDKLLSYEAGFLGILPSRDGAEGAVSIRYVYPGSPAEKGGLKAGMQILSAGGVAVPNAEALSQKLGRAKPGDTLEFVVDKPDAPPKSLVLDATTDRIPVELTPALLAPQPEKNADGPKTGRIADRMAAHNRDYWAYVPDDYSPANRYGLVVWIHPPGDTMEKETLDRWKTPCQERGLIVLAPKAGDGARWTPEDIPFVIEITKQFTTQYAIDRARVVIHSFGRGAPPALEAATREKSLYRGICLAGAGVRGRFPEPEPDTRQQYLLICGEGDPALEAVRAMREALGELRVPATLLTIEKGTHKYPGGRAFEAVVRWVDSLDRM
jgi:serine protease Do